MAEILDSKKIGFLGGGNMASCIVSGLIKSKCPANQILVCDKNPEKLSKLHVDYEITTTDNIQHLIETSDILVIAIKPQDFFAAIIPVQSLLIAKRPLFISIAAGITCKQMQRHISTDLQIIRAMPNTPSLIGAGATGLYATENVSQIWRETATQIFSNVGMAAWVDSETMLDALMAISGCGPAYMFLILDYISQVGKDFGLDSKLANALSIQTMLGSALMAKNSELDFAQLRSQVMSKGGATAAAIEEMQKLDLKAVFEQAMSAAQERAKTISQEITT